MRTAAEWVPILREMVEHVRQDPPYIGVLSMGERCAVALVIDVESLLNPDGEGGRINVRPSGYTWLDCVHRIEGELLEACVIVQREDQP